MPIEDSQVPWMPVEHFEMTIPCLPNDIQVHPMSMTRLGLILFVFVQLWDVEQ